MTTPATRIEELRRQTAAPTNDARIVGVVAVLALELTKPPIGSQFSV